LRHGKTPHIRYRAGYIGLKHCPLSSNGSGEFTKNYFYWEFDANPSTFSKIYRVLLVWDFKYVVPNVYILNNELCVVGLTHRIPHIYCKEKIKLCLYFPDYNEFDRTMSLCESVIPWTYLWLQYYEEWLYSGEWKGGDAPHPLVSNVKEDNDSTQESSRVKKIKKPVSDIIYERRKKYFDMIENKS